MLDAELWGVRTLSEVTPVFAELAMNYPPRLTQAEKTLVVFKWAARQTSAASGIAINHVTDSVAKA